MIKRAKFVPVLFSILLVLSSALPPRAAGQSAQKAVVMAWDGTVSFFAQQLLRAGKLPNLAKLIEGGAFADDVLAGFPDEHRWGVNATLIGDAYLNFGLTGVVVVMWIYGALLKLIYMKFRRGQLHSAVYVLAIVYGMQILWGSIEVWPQAVVVLTFAFAIALLGETIFKLRFANSRLGFATHGER